MEFPKTALNVQRALAALMLILALGAAAVERSSPISARIRESKPWPFWLALHQPGRAAAPALHLGVYDPVRRSCALIRVPETTKLQGKLTAARVYVDALRATDNSDAATRALEDLAEAKISSLSLEPISWQGSGRLTLGLDPDDEDEDEPAVSAIRALKARGRSPKALWALVRRAVSGLARGDAAAADTLILTLELRRTPLESLEPALLPDDASAPSYLARVFARPAVPPSEEKAIVVEVLNGTSVQGLAGQAMKVLRSRGMDAMVNGQAPRPRLRTVVYDRTGDFDRAARVRTALGCPAAIAATRIDVMRAVDASVELGEDCRF